MAGNEQDEDLQEILKDLKINTTTEAILQNVWKKIIETCNREVERALNQNYFLADQEMGTLWKQISVAAMNEFDKKSQGFEAIRDPEFKKFTAELETRKAYYFSKNSEKKADHQRGLRTFAQELFENYKEMMKELRQDENADSKLLAFHDSCFNKLTAEYSSQYGDSPLFDPQLLESLISAEYPKIEKEIKTKSIQDQINAIHKASFSIYNREIKEVKAEDDFEEAHIRAIELVEIKLPREHNNKFIETINIRSVLEGAKEYTRDKVYARIKATRESTQEAKVTSLYKFYEIMGPPITSRNPIDAAQLESRYQEGRQEALELFHKAFEKLTDRVKNPAQTKDDLIQQIDRTFQEDYLKRVSKNKENWDEYKRNLKAVEQRCNQFFRSAMSRIPPDDEAQRKQVKEEVKKMFEDVAKPRIFEPLCIRESRKNIDAFKDDEDLEDFEFLSDSTNEYTSEPNLPEEGVGVGAIGKDNFGLQYDFLVKMVNGTLSLQEDVLRKCVQVTDSIGAARIVFVSHAGQRNSGKTTAANETLQHLQAHDLLKPSFSDSETFQNYKFPSDAEKSRLKANGVLTLLRPTITTYGGMTAAVFVLDIAENDATEPEYTSLVDFMFLVSSTTLFAARQSNFELSAWNPKKSVVQEFFGHKTLDKLCVLLQASFKDMSVPSGFIDPKTASEISDEYQLNSVKGISAFSPYFRRVSYYAIPCRGNEVELGQFLESVLAPQQLLSCPYALHHTASCEATLKERVQQINCLANLLQTQR